MRRRARGQVLITFALFFLLFLFWMFCAVVDIDFVFTEATFAQAAAQDAATTGANTINPQFLYSPQVGGGGVPPLSSSGPYNSVQSCQNAGTYDFGVLPGGTNCTVLPGGCSITADTSLWVRLPLPLPLMGRYVLVKGHFDGRVVIGVDSATSTC